MDKLQSFFQDAWAIDPVYHRRMLSVVLPMITSGNLKAAENQLSKNKIKAYASTPYLADKWDLNDSNLPDNSIAVLKLDGVLYSWDTFNFEDLLRMIMSNNKIVGVVVYINGPGGMVTNVDVVEGLISNYSKPIACFISGMACSAHYWIASAADRTFIASPMCIIGSIGVFMDYADYKGMYEKMGIDIREIYPDSSDLKNYETRQIADNNNEDPLKQSLEIICNRFCLAVSKNIGIPYNPTNEFFRGKTYTGDVAVANGYINQFGTLEDATAWVLAQAIAKQVNNIY
jgi:signal peptide peptidase SppA